MNWEEKRTGHEMNCETCLENRFEGLKEETGMTREDDDCLSPEESCPGFSKKIPTLASGIHSKPSWSWKFLQEIQWLFLWQDHDCDSLPGSLYFPNRDRNPSVDRPLRPRLLFLEGMMMMVMQRWCQMSWNFDRQNEDQMIVVIEWVADVKMMLESFDWVAVVPADSKPWMIPWDKQTSRQEKDCYCYRRLLGRGLKPYTRLWLALGFELVKQK